MISLCFYFEEVFVFNESLVGLGEAVLHVAGAERTMAALRADIITQNLLEAEAEPLLSFQS